MIDFALEKYPVRYPLETSVHCLIRPLETPDKASFMKFLHEVPEFERLFIKQRLDNPALVKEWCAGRRRRLVMRRRGRG
jgi:hypothetical protein